MVVDMRQDYRNLERGKVIASAADPCTEQAHKALLEALESGVLRSAEKGEEATGTPISG
jgi:hypothetical protein